MGRLWMNTWLLAVLILLIGCDTSTPPPDKGATTAREQLEHLGISYNRDVFLREAADGNTTAVELLLAAGMAPNTRNLAHETALWKAAEKGQLETVQVLLDKGADVNAKDVWGITPLMKAAENGYTAIVQVLLDRGADMYAKDNLGRTALQRAADNAHMDIVQLLTKAGAGV